MKRNNLNSHQVPSEPGKQEARAITPNVAHNASTFAWHKYSLYKKLLRIVAYMLRSFPKCACNWTKTASVTDPAEYVPSLNRKTGLHRQIETSKPTNVFALWSQLVREFTIHFLASWNWISVETPLLPGQESKLLRETFLSRYQTCPRSRFWF